MFRKSPFATAAVLFCCLILSPAVAQAGSPREDESAKSLAGNPSRNWLEDDITTWMGGDAPCSPGRVYGFRADRTLKIDECVNGERRSRTTSWTLTADGPLDIIVTIDGSVYLLLFYKANGQEHMTLRQRGDSKIDPITDHDFILLAD